MDVSALTEDLITISVPTVSRNLTAKSATPADFSTPFSLCLQSAAAAAGFPYSATTTPSSTTTIEIPDT